MAKKTKLIPTQNEGNLEELSQSNDTELMDLAQLSLDFDAPKQEPSTSSEYFDKFSPFIVYVDESGTANFDKPGNRSSFPVFVLAFCVFYKHVYTTQLVPEIQSLKFNFFGHDLVILHEKEIRKNEPPFRFSSRELDRNFLSRLSSIMDETKFILISTVIKKNEISREQENLYHLALQPCLINLYKLMIEKNCHHQITYIVVEARGEKEDRDLELEFRRICDGQNPLRIKLPFEILIKSKATNSTGLQFADLCARPIGRHIIDNIEGRKNVNRAFESLKHKFLCNGGRELCGVEASYKDIGLVVIPS
ncbi:DUF3800 domain-containing protein [Vitreoscilla massiliensis]|uniref:DUF3800 domain-containing protein n=1 Tax=Vitreoscilla massiliensis TaxID=1689272 RepID=A0ABY4E0M8_9NEIS|nr:DUF3800 domain-containing protein [Vitreoscilla massiliensis]UOO89102.1 DUF3800 domain-containing protein [Vitreoscilla massiliensis]